MSFPMPEDIPLPSSDGIDPSTYTSRQHPKEYESNSVAVLSSKTAALMRDTFSIVHLQSCEIYPDQLQFQEQIGEGEYGLVYKGLWRGRACAIKKLKSGITKESVEYQRLLMELGILVGVGSHPNIVSFFGACIQDFSCPLIVEELVDGMNLKDYLSGKPLGFNLGRSKVRAWSLDLLQALAHLHGLTPAVMHRDIKPANILVSRDRRALKLADFGLAKRLGAAAGAGSPPRGPVLRQHSIEVGTPRYMAPEVLEQLIVDGAETRHAVYTEKADVYSAALLLWYLLAGRPPPPSARRDPLQRPDAGLARRRWVAMAALLERMWAQDAEARPAAAECVAAVRRMTPGAAGCVPAPAEACRVQ